MKGMEMPRRFLIVEDHPIYAEALELTIRSGMSDVRITQAGTLCEAKNAIQEGKDFDLALLDLWLPDTHGFEGLIELRNLFPRLPVVVVSAFADKGVIHKALVCGAAGFIPKSARKYTLLHAISDVLAGSVTMPSDYMPAEALATLELTALTSKLKSLTHQQLRVLQMLCQGLLNKQIAHQLDVGETTVKAHVSEILRKLSVCSRTQAVLEISKLDFSAVLALYAGEEADSSIPIARANHRISEKFDASLAR
jgi:DNA-binding NarL/FixJ family response regulator